IPQSRMDSATRETRARTPDSRSGVPTWPWRYLEATILVAVMDQEEGVSTSFCSKMILPLKSWMTASRFSQVSSSKGDTPGLVKWRSNFRPRALWRPLAEVAVEVLVWVEAAELVTMSAMGEPLTRAEMAAARGLRSWCVGGRKRPARGEAGLALTWGSWPPLVLRVGAEPGCGS